jgi:cyanate permease
MGWWGTYMPTGSALAMLMGPWVIAAANWSVWWWCMGLVSALAGVAVWWCVPDTQADAPATHAPPWTQRLGLTLRSREPWLLSLTFAVYSSQWLAVVGFLPTVYAELGLAAGLAGVLSACVALANVIGNIFSGLLLQRGWSAQRLMTLAFVTMSVGAIGAYAVWQGHGLPIAWRFVCVLLFSALGGLIPGTLFACAMRLAPSEATLSTTVGYMQQWSALGQFAGPPAVAWVALQVGGWQWTWTVSLAFSVMGIWLAHLIHGALLRKETLHD